MLAMVEGADACLGWGIVLGLNLCITVGRAYSEKRISSNVNVER